jgi:glycerol-3-phosphate dehydrogenase
MQRTIPQDIQEYPFDLIVIGAGINGTGIARDAAMRGLRVLVLEKDDVASGTTAWSTRLIHGGLRYLEYYEFHLVRESLSEREKLLSIAPHLVKPLGFVVPVYESSKRGPLMVQAGMILYDTLSFNKSLDRHKILSREETLRQVPGLNSDGLKAAALYYDGQVEYAERLAVENAVSAHEHGAYILNYARADKLIVENGAVQGVEFTDLLTGEERVARAPVTVNVAGPWVDHVLAGADEAHGPESGYAERMIGGTKGSHIVVDPFPGAPSEALYVEARADGRPYFVVPWNGRYLIGTTDLRYEGDLDHVEAEEWEIEYLLDETNFVIPQANLTRGDVLFTYSGVRPLPYQPAGSESSVTRSHIVHDHAKGGRNGGEAVGGLVSIVGGKLTTYRNLSRQTVDLVYRKLGHKPPACRTAEVPLPGGETADFEAFSARFRAESGLPEPIPTRLLSLYGARAPEVLALADENPGLREPLGSSERPETALIGAEVVYAFRTELAKTLADVLLRRTMTGMGPHVGLDVDEAAARVAAERLGWDDDRVDRELREYRDFVSRYHPRDLASRG